MRALQLSKNLSRTLFFTASTSSFPYRTITTATTTTTTGLLSSPACHNHIHRRTESWLSTSSSANLLRSPWSLTQHRGIRVSGSDVSYAFLFCLEIEYVFVSKMWLFLINCHRSKSETWSRKKVRFANCN